MFAAEDRGEVPKGTAERWAHHTKSIKALPEHVKKHSKKHGKKTTKKAALICLVSQLQKQAVLRKIAEHLAKKADAPAAAAPQTPQTGPMQPMQAGQASGAAMTPRKSDDIAKHISQFGETHRGRAAYERLAQYRRGAVRGYAAASQPDAKKRFQQSLGKAGAEEPRIGTPFMDGFIASCMKRDLSGDQMADLLEKAAESKGRLGEEARRMLDRMLKL
jgi:hypothetical protein